MKQLKTFWQSIYFVPVVNGLLILLTLTAHSCSPSRKLVKAMNTLDKHPDVKAKMCARDYPVKEKTTTKTVYKPGRKVVTHDTFRIDCDSVVKTSNISKTETSKIVRIPIPTYLQVDTAAIEMEVERENVAALAVREYEIDALKNDLYASMVKQDEAEKQAATFKKKHRNKTYWLIGVLLSIGAYVAIKWRIEFIKNKFKQAGRYLS